jgi:DNA-binding CsgD family transcriptional regulator
MGIAFATVLIQATLLDKLRDNLIVLYAVYVIIAVMLIILYLILEPYLIYSFRSRTLQDLIGVVAEDTDERKTAELEAIPIVKAVEVKHIEPEDETLHSRRMKILLTHTLSPLTRREYQLADCIMRGLRRSEIAQEMGLKPATVTQYTNTVYDKFGIHKRQELFRLAEKLEREWGDEE